MRSIAFRTGINIAMQCLLLFIINLTAAEAQSVSLSQQQSSMLNGDVKTATPVFNPLSGPDYPLSQDSYFTDDSGNILMIINVLGEVNKQGQLIVRENVDFATILALSGGLKPEANLKEVLVARQEPDKNGIQAYTIDLKKYYKHGDRSSFIALKPNDTVIIPEKAISIYKLASIMSIAYPWVSAYSILHK
jgi:hypothetical protein